MNLIPMLAASMPRTWTDEKFFQHIATKLPLIVQIKLDGIRCIINEHHVPVSRTLKPIPNKWIRQQLADLRLPVGFDGEIIVDWKNFNRTSSEVMSERGTPNFDYVVFDWIRPFAYKERFTAIEEYLYIDGKPKYPNVFSVKSFLAYTLDEVKQCAFVWIEQDGAEGIMLRKPFSLYKHGRSTFNQFFLVKYKPWERSEATIVGFEELMINENAATTNALGHIERASGAHNLKPSGMLGALVCKSPEFKETFKVGTGFTDDDRRRIWVHRFAYYDVSNAPVISRKITFKYQANRTKKDKPISPVFEGFLI